MLDVSRIEPHQIVIRSCKFMLKIRLCYLLFLFTLTLFPRNINTPLYFLDWLIFSLTPLNFASIINVVWDKHIAKGGGCLHLHDWKPYERSGRQQKWTQLPFYCNKCQYRIWIVVAFLLLIVSLSRENDSFVSTQKKSKADYMEFVIHRMVTTSNIELKWKIGKKIRKIVHSYGFQLIFLPLPLAMSSKEFVYKLEFGSGCENHIEN